MVTCSLLICTLISENKLGLYYKSEKKLGDKLKKNPGLQDLKFF
jgi:hypothetical protein